MKTAVVTDSNSGIFGEEARRLGIHVIPMPIIIDDQTFFENEDITPGQFFEAQVGGRSVSSSQPSPASILDIWELVLENADELVYIPMSSGLSGACQTAKMLADDYDGKVQVVDNHRISVSLKQSVLRALFLAKQGMDAKQIKDKLEEESYTTTIYLTVESLTYFKRSGRITPAVAALGDMLNIKPVLSTKGDAFDTYSKVRGLEKARSSLFELIKHERETTYSAYDDNEILIPTAGSFINEEDAKAWVQRAADYFPNNKVFYNMLSLSIACHTGPNACGLGILLNPENKL